MSEATHPRPSMTPTGRRGPGADPTEPAELGAVAQQIYAQLVDDHRTVTNTLRTVALSALTVGVTPEDFFSELVSMAGRNDDGAARA